MVSKPKVSVEGDWFARRYLEGDALEADVAREEAIRKAIAYLNAELEKLTKPKREKPEPQLEQERSTPSRPVERPERASVERAPSGRGRP